MSRNKPSAIDPWTGLRRLTPARIALGRAGPAWPTDEVLAFGLAHARARDAVHLALDVDALEAQLRADGYAPLRVQSAAADRPTYLRRPDFGRRLDAASGRSLDAHRSGPDLAVVVADGLSALAVQRHVCPLLAALRMHSPALWEVAPVIIATQARVALGDEIGERLGAGFVVVMIGERPGLSSPDSLGLYLTHAPRVGRTDAERNCISNVRPEGLGYGAAAAKLDWLVREGLRRGITGVALKDESEVPILQNVSVSAKNNPETGSRSRSPK